MPLKVQQGDQEPTRISVTTRCSWDPAGRTPLEGHQQALGGSCPVIVLARTTKIRTHLLPFYGDGVSSDVAVSYTVFFEEVGDGWIQARLHELPAVITAAPSREQAAEDVIDALREYLLSLRDVPEPRNKPEDAADTVQLTIALGGC